MESSNMEVASSEFNEIRIDASVDLDKADGEVNEAESPNGKEQKSFKKSKKGKKGRSKRLSVKEKEIESHLEADDSDDKPLATRRTRRQKAH